MIVYTEPKTVASDLGIPLKTLYRVSNSASRHYKKIRIPKRDGTERELSVPDSVLKSIQRAILNKLLVYEPVSPYAYAYRYGTSVVKNASLHVGKSRVLKLDIDHFFDSITYYEVKEKCFPAERFSEPVRILLSMLCYCGDVLPQGAPTSPAITNIVMRDFDMTVGAFCAERGITYSRYCDDMTFSGELDSAEIIDFVKNQLKKQGFRLKGSKTRLLPASRRQTVTGLVVNEAVSVPNEYKRKLRQEVYYCKKFGVESHTERLGVADVKEYLSSLLGRITYALSATPDDPELVQAKEYVLSLIKNK